MKAEARQNGAYIERLEHKSDLHTRKGLVMIGADPLELEGSKCISTSACLRQTNSSIL
jgi:hypothetical protein